MIRSMFPSSKPVGLLSPPNASASRNWPRALLAMLGCGAVLRVLIWLWFAPLAPAIHDEQAHVSLATNIVQYGEYTFDPNGVPTSLRPPLYPAFVAGVFKVFGVNNFQAVRLIQAAISLITVVIIFRLGRDLMNERAGLCAAGLMCFYPTLLGFNSLILSEVLFTLLLVSGVYSLASGMTHSSYRSLALAGVLLGLGALTRSILYPFAPILCLFLLAVWRGSPVNRVVAVLAFAVPFALVLAPWAIRNTRLHDTFIPVDCMGGRNFMMGNYEYTPLYRSWDAISITGEQEWIHVLKTNHPEVVNVSQGKLDKFALSEGVRYVRENPGRTVQRDLVKFFDYWGLERELVAGASRGYFGAIPKWAVVAIGLAICGVYALILFAGAFGAARHPFSDGRVHALILLLLGFTCAVHTLVFAHSRYHLPIMPFVMIYAAAFITRSGTFTWRRPGAWLGAAFCTVVAGGWAWGLLAVDLPAVTALI